MTSIAAPTSNLQRNTALFLTFAMAAVVGAALGFEHIGHYMPCKLCLEQRLPYYIGVPAVALAAMSAAMRWPPAVTRGLLCAGGLLMAWSLFLAVRHSGVAAARNASASSNVRKSGSTSGRRGNSTRGTEAATATRTLRISSER